MIVWTLAAIVAVLLLVVSALVLFTAWVSRQAEKAVPPRGRFVEVDGARIHYLDEGSGPVVLLIHGLSGQMYNFTHSLFAPLKRDFRVVVLDRPGSGYSTRPAHGGETVADQARIISHFCEKLSLGQPLVAGHSLGGAIALALAVNHPYCVGGLALIAPATEKPDRVPDPFGRLIIRSRLVRRLVAWTLAVPMSIASSARTLAVLFGPQPVPADFGVRGGGLLSLRPVSFVGASTDLVAAQDAEEPPARHDELTMPVGILFGTADRVLDPALHGKAFAAKLKDAELELIDGGGHMIPVTSADRAAAFIARMARRMAAVAAPGPAAKV